MPAIWDQFGSVHPPAVREFSRGPFLLNHDLHCLTQVHGTGATEATIFYAARILEMLAASALDALNLPASTNLFANLDLLERYNLIPAATRYGAHALRRQGNDVRHICRAITFTDADLAIGFVQVVLHWFFCNFPMGPRLTAIGDRSLSLEEELTTGHEILLAALGCDDADVAALTDQCLTSGHTLLTSTPVVPAVLVERLLDREDYPRAWAVLERAGQTFGDDLRLRQLRGLYLSRTGRIDEAIQCLHQLDQSGDDEETIGILAGAHKRRWLARREHADSLKKAHRLYRLGWERSRRTSPYMGINAATTALWLREVEQSRRLASEVLALLQDRATRLAVGAGASRLTLNSWDRITMAEALLLLGELDAARKTYHEVFAIGDKERAVVDVGRRQAAEILSALGFSEPDAEQFLKATTP